MSPYCATVADNQSNISLINREVIKREGGDDLSETTIDRWLTRPEVADRLHIPKQTLAQWACQGLGPRFAKFGRHVRYRLVDVEAWEAEAFNRS